MLQLAVGKNILFTRKFYTNHAWFCNRLELLLPWLSNFIEYYLKDVYSDYGWEIDINTMDNKNGGFKKSNKKLT